MVRALLGLSLLCSAGAHADDTRYVRERMAVQLRAAQSQDSAVVHQGLASGSAVTLLQNDEKSGFARVRSADGVEGWIANRFLSSEPGASAKLEEAKKEIAELRKANAELKLRQESLPANEREAVQQLAELQKSNEQLQQQVDHLENQPNSPMQLEALRQRNEELQTQFEKLGASIEAARTQRDTAMFRNGALAIIGGMLLALIVPYLRPKKKSDWA